MTPKEALISLSWTIANDPSGNVAPLLPALLRLNNKPYSLTWSHYFFEPMFKMRNSPRKLLYLTGRQVAKSSSVAAAQLLKARIQNNYNIMTIMPLFEQVRKFSQNYVKPFIQTSPVSSIFRDPDNTNSVLQRSLANGSNLFYQYCHGGADRARGVSCSEINCDEIQDMDVADLPILEANMSASPFKLVRYTGTPKTFDNTISVLWDDSSQAVWHIPCQTTGCKHLNRCTVDKQGGDLLDMLGDLTLVCAKCRQPVNSRLGFYVHDRPERQLTFAGYKVSQPILPMHYESPKAWSVLKDFQRDKPLYAFYNEILGEPFDSGSKLVTHDQLVAAAQVEPREPHETDFNRYIMTGTGVDWGGRGKERTSDAEDFISNTAIAVGGLRPDGIIEVTWLHKVPYTVDVSEDSQVALQAAAASNSSYIALDYGGQGNVQESLLTARGWPVERVMPFTYAVMAPTKPIVFYTPPQVRGVRSSYTLDKPRSLLLLCELVKRGMVLLPKSDRYLNDHLKDFLNICEESMDNPRGSPTRLVKRMSRRTDDVVHAINFLVMSLYHASQSWPAVTAAFVDQS